MSYWNKCIGHSPMIKSKLQHYLFETERKRKKQSDKYRLENNKKNYKINSIMYCIIASHAILWKLKNIPRKKRSTFMNEWFANKESVIWDKMIQNYHAMPCHAIVDSLSVIIFDDTLKSGRVFISALLLFAFSAFCVRSFWFSWFADIYKHTRTHRTRIIIDAMLLLLSFFVFFSWYLRSNAIQMQINCRNEVNCNKRRQRIRTIECE